MTETVAKLMAERLRELQFLEVVCGIATSQEIRVGDVIKSLPACENDKGRVLLTPDSKRAAIAYFEDLGTSQMETLNAGRGALYDSRLRLVVWLNNARLSPEISTSSAIHACISKLVGNYADFPPVSYLRVNPLTEAIRDKAIFGKWTLDEAELQYLMYPYSYFAYDFSASYAMQTYCEPTINTKELCC
jgi:hypothetical protein